jgi:hypothetical protein
MDSGFEKPTKQRNIIAVVGNGFDIQVLQDYGYSVDTRYESFYHFLKLHSFSEGNLIFKEMERLRQAGKENWSDVEGAVGALLSANRAIANQLRTALLELQAQFSDFLDMAIPSSLLVDLGEDSMDRSLAVESLAKFLGDLDENEYRNLKFPSRSENFDIYNFLFFNFNYTPLLDNFIYLDQKQFDPLRYRTVDRNFRFEGNPSDVSGAAVRPGDYFSSYVMTEIVHPHGNQGVPRSLLFGVDTPEIVSGNQDQALRLAKPFWAQHERRYGHLFEDTELFILFGCSLGESDRWWWKSIADAIGRECTCPGGIESFHPEMIIYWYNSEESKITADDVRRKFLESAGKVERYDELKEYIRVVMYDSATERTWLKTS